MKNKSGLSQEEIAQCLTMMRRYESQFVSEEEQWEKVYGLLKSVLDDALKSDDQDKRQMAQKIYTEIAEDDILKQKLAISFFEKFNNRLQTENDAEKLSLRQYDGLTIVLHSFEKSNIDVEQAYNELQQQKSGNMTFLETFDELLAKRASQPEYDIKDAPAAYKKVGITRQSFSDMVCGKKGVSKDFAMRLAFGLKCNLDEAQMLLKSAGKVLYPTIPLDNICIYCYKNGIHDLGHVDELIQYHNEKNNSTRSYSSKPINYFL